MEQFLKKISKLRTIEVRRKGIVQKIVDELLTNQNEQRTGLSKTGIAKEIIKTNPEVRNIDIARMLKCSDVTVAHARSQLKNLK